MNKPVTAPSASIISGSRLNYCWRLVATGFSFLMFCTGGIAIALMCSLVGLIMRDRARRATLARSWLSRIFRLYLRMLRGLGLITYEIRHLDRIKPQGQLVIANHPSLLDVCFVISLIDNTDCIVKAALWRWPLTAMPVRAANYLKNFQEGLIERALASLKTGASLIIFPEGTRSEPGSLRPFHRGASNIAIMSGLPVTPVVITCQPATLLKSQRWYQISPSRPHYIVSVMEDIQPAGIFAPDDLQSRAARKLNAYLEHYFAAAVKAQQNT